jgi:predicted RNA-binding protein (virulence factor B family)
MICTQTDLGYKVIINNLHWGILYHNEIFKPVRIGQKLKGYIKTVREDEKIDVCLQKPGYDKVEGIAGDILDYLKKNNGFMPITDKTDPEMIYQYLGVSKKAYKNAIGALYKKGLITLDWDGTKLKS